MPTNNTMSDNPNKPNKQAQRQYYAMPRALRSAIDKVASTAVGRDWDIWGMLLGRWPEIAGSEYADITTPIKITRSRTNSALPRQTSAKISGNINGQPFNNTVLTIRAPRGLVMEMNMRAPILLERIACCLGKGKVNNIKIEADNRNSQDKIMRGIGAAKIAEYRKGSGNMADNCHAGDGLDNQEQMQSLQKSGISSPELQSALAGLANVIGND